MRGGELIHQDCGLVLLPPLLSYFSPFCIPPAQVCWCCYPYAVAIQHIQHIRLHISPTLHQNAFRISTFLCPDNNFADPLRHCSLKAFHSQKTHLFTVLFISKCLRLNYKYWRKHLVASSGSFQWFTRVLLPLCQSITCHECDWEATHSTVNPIKHPCHTLTPFHRPQRGQGTNKTTISLGSHD